MGGRWLDIIGCLNGFLAYINGYLCILNWGRYTTSMKMFVLLVIFLTANSFFSMLIRLNS